MGVFQDLTGKQYGQIKVLKGLQSTNSSGSRYWVCECVCGKLFKVSTSSLNSGVKSCGCISRKAFVVEQRGKLGLRARLNNCEKDNKKLVFNNYKHNARRRKLPFLLSLEEFVTITSKKCYYCGKPPGQFLTTRGASQSHYIYNGIDRVDNSLGYTLDNVVPCCKQCNRAKGALTTQEFKTWAENLISFINK
jgi:5-methylcytosine-specific restriction endonuclease McrA